MAESGNSVLHRGQFISSPALSIYLFISLAH
jgi:hypothetical protein